MKSFGEGEVHTQSNNIQEGLYTGNHIENLRKRYMYDINEFGLNSGALLPSAGGKLIRRSIYITSIQTVPNDIFQAEDLIHNFEVLNLCNSIFIWDCDCYRYRIRSLSASKKVSLKTIDNVFLVYNYLISKYPTYCNQISVYTISRLWNTIAYLHKNDVSSDDIYSQLLINQFASYKVPFNSAKIGKCSLFDKIKINVVANIKWRVWKMILYIKY